MKYYTKFLTSDTHTVLLKLHAKLAPGWALIRVNFDPVQEIGRKVGGGRSFVSGPFFARLRYQEGSMHLIKNMYIPNSKVHLITTVYGILQTSVATFLYVCYCTVDIERF